MCLEAPQLVFHPGTHTHSYPQVRFSKHVLPGDTLEVVMWAQPREGAVIFETRVKGRAGAAISNAAVVFRPGRMRAGGGGGAVAKL